MPIRILYQHDIAIDALVIKLFDGAGLIETLTMSLVEGARCFYWEAEMTTPEKSALEYQVFENDEEFPAAWGTISGLIPDATIELGTDQLTAGELQSQLQGMMAHGDSHWAAAASEVTVSNLLPSALAQLADKPLKVAIPTLSGQQLSEPLVRGDSYLNEHNRAIVFSRSDFPDIPEGSSARLTAVLDSSCQASFSIPGTVVIATGQKVVRFEPTSEMTAHWQPGRYEFDVEIEFPDGNVATFVGPNVFLRVLQDVTT